MTIRQITSKVVCGPHQVGKWFCADYAQGSDGEVVNRYLQANGTWGKNTHYFDAEAEIHQQLAKGYKPDFTISKNEALSRQMLRDWQDSVRDDYEEC